MQNKIKAKFYDEKIDYVPCNLCGSNSEESHMEVNGFKIVKCKNCNLIYVNPRLKEKELHKIYNKKYYKNSSFETYEPSIYGYTEYLKEKKFIVATFQKRLEQIQKFSKVGRLLDIGCAFGFFLEPARKNGWDVQGLEISEIAYNHSKNKLKLPVLNKTLEEAKFKSNSFDVVTMFDVIEHLSDPKKALKEVRRILKPNGLIVITTPDIGSVAAKILGKNWEEVKRVREHIYFFSKDTLKSMLESLSFKVLRIESAGRYFSVEYAIKRGKLYNKEIFNLIEKFSNWLNLNKAWIYVNPYYKITLYARKI